jgi:hypothetical protein
MSVGHRTNMSDPTRKKAIDAAMNVLTEHFDTVQILTTYQEDGNTFRCFKGAGNLYARIGMVHEFLLRERLLTEKEERDKLEGDN